MSALLGCSGSVAFLAYLTSTHNTDTDGPSLGEGHGHTAWKPKFWNKLKSRHNGSRACISCAKCKSVSFCCGVLLHYTAGAAEHRSHLFRPYPNALKSFTSIWFEYVKACCTGVYWLLYFMHEWPRKTQSVLAYRDKRSPPGIQVVFNFSLKNP